MSQETKKNLSPENKILPVKVPEIITLLKSGVHFGHKTSKWHPSMKNFIFGERKGIHIIDLKQTINCLKEALAFIKQTITNGGILLLIGTKDQIKNKIKEIALETNIPYVNGKWISGTITNWPIIRKQILKLKKNKEDKEKGEWSKYTKKEQLLLQKNFEKLERLYGGIINLDKIPDAVFIVDYKKDKTAVREANLKNVPVIALADTNVDTRKIDYPIPANDDAVKSLNLMLDAVKEAILEAQRPPTPALEELADK